MWEREEEGLKRVDEVVRVWWPRARREKSSFWVEMDYKEMNW